MDQRRSNIAQESKLFISYRREDAEGQAGRLYDRLNAAFPGRIFRDVSGIDIGVDFARAIQEAIACSVVCVVVIGRQWIRIANDQGQPRIQQPNDYVRLEIATALDHGLRVIPVLVDGAKMPVEQDLPDNIQPLTRINAIELTVTDYDHLVDRLVSALERDLGKRATPGGSGDAREQIEILARRAEASVALEDWMSAIQMLQSALSLDANNASLAARLRHAQQQLHLSGLYADGQQRYRTGDKTGALESFRQIRIAAGSYKNSDQLISQIESDLRRTPPAPPKKKSRWLQWTVGAVAALALIGYAVDQSQSKYPSRTAYNSQPAYVSQAPAAQPHASETTASQPQTAQVSPSDNRLPADEPTQSRQAAEPAPDEGFTPQGQWDMRSEINPALGFLITFSDDGQFSVQTRAGYYQFPGSAGNYTYDSANHFLIFTGINNMGVPFREPLQITGRHGDHLHVMYSGTQWALSRH